MNDYDTLLHSLSAIAEQMQGGAASSGSGPITAKEVERQSYIVGDQIEVFHCAQAEAALSEKVIPIRAVPRMYVSMLVPE